MEFKPDWESAKVKYEKWWNKELKKPILEIQAPKNMRKHNRYAWNGWNLVTDRENPEKAIDAFEKMAEDNLYLGEAYPNFWLNLGPGVLAAYITGFLGFNGHTVWFEHPMEWDEIDKALDSFDENNEWWVYTKKIAHMIGKRSKGKYLTGMTDIGGILDVLASLRGTQTLLFDLIDSPDRVIHALDKITNLWHYCYDELNKVLSQYMEGTSTWMGIWCPQRWYSIQCDFSAMISPDMFEKFVAPYLREQCRRLDHTIYHWDGPGEIPHLDILLGIDELDGIQWTPGAGNPFMDSEQWLGLYKRIQDKGKLLVLSDYMPPERIPGMIDKISPEGVLVAAWCKSEKEAYKLLEWREKL